MHAESDGGEVEGEEAVEEVGEGVVVVCDEGVGDFDGVVPRLVEGGEAPARGGVEDVCVNVVLDGISHHKPHQSMLDHSPWIWKMI